jgi:hypothetical protein
MMGEKSLVQVLAGLRRTFPNRSRKPGSDSGLTMVRPAPVIRSAPRSATGRSGKIAPTAECFAPRRPAQSRSCLRAAPLDMADCRFTRDGVAAFVG